MTSKLNKLVDSGEAFSATIKRIILAIFVMAHEKVNSLYLSLRKGEKKHRLPHKSSFKSQSAKLFGKELNQKLKSQSAMEYLMTYGWAILIIAIVMVALFSLGIFNSHEPRVQPGACEVYRSVASSPVLTGECQGVWPQFVAQFNGASSYIQVPDTLSLSVGDPRFTFSAWINPQSLSSCGTAECIIFNKENSYEWAISSNGQICWAIRNTAPGWNWECPNIYVSVDHFTYLSVTYDGTYVKAYIDGNPATPQSATGNVDNTNYQNALRIGARGAPGSASSLFYGIISNVQIYNTSLSQSEVTALYQEGIGGAPIDPTHIVGWWPLNGNAQDYSGNGNNGQAIGVSYTSAWTSGYTQP